MSWLRALRETARSGLEIERRRLEPLIAVRGAAGLALVVGVSLALFGPVIAAGSAFGAFQAAIATFQRSWRPRPVLALVSGVSLAVSTFVGYVTVSHTLLFLALLVLWTFAAGMSWAAGPTGGIIAGSNVSIMLVTITLPTSVLDAAAHAGMMAFGGFVQAALIVLFPVRRWGAQRDALADALAGVADYARRLRNDPVAPFDPVPLMTARNAAAVTPRQARRRPADLHGARGVAERLRPVLASLADPALGVPAEGPERYWVWEILGAAGSLLDSAARAVRHGDPVQLDETALSVLKSPDTEVILTGPPRRAADRLVSLLADVIEIAEGTGTDDRTPGEPLVPHRRRPTLLRLVPVVHRSMRREMRRGSTILRHAVRVSAVAAAGYLLGAVLPFGHGYWAPMTAVMVMRPEFTQTYSRSVARFMGTVVGVAVATGIVQAAHPNAELSALLAVVSAGLMYLLMRTGYAVSQVCVSAYVVFLLGMAGDDWSQTVPERVVLTLIGGLLAMVAYAIYPAWETPRLRDRLAAWVVTDGRYAATVLDRYADPASRSLEDVRTALLTTREARVAWQEALETARHEPVRHRGISRTSAADAQDALAQFGRVAMLMEAHLPAASATPVPEAAGLADALRRATEEGAKAVRERRIPDWGPVREALEPRDAAPGQPPPDSFVRNGATLLLRALDDFSQALEIGSGRA
ncbi:MULTISPECIES: FUSC family protein [unclassified Streptomyces]|uniref:FUSC family protein n=1 Tax=unclassified Streptomyces TaxID=2593676 RepID=UPI0011C8F5AB|nr:MULTISPECIES: FUSC family protein [unclassified Streptomyces]TXS17304.1 FUSC family protein [Streptomyces sp. wa22]WSQ79081.1 FUSC family protein [Streptomyces sp. NBC_01213]WSR49744.1 FUSC family protein [Streptomyces sp. NBC_01201]